MEILDITNLGLGLPHKNNWNVLAINVDSNSLSGELKKVKSDLLDNIGKYTNIEKVFCNGILNPIYCLAAGIMQVIPPEPVDLTMPLEEQVDMLDLILEMMYLE